MAEKILFFIVSLLFLSGCEDPLTRARRVINTQPKEALELLKEATQSDHGCRECPLYAAMAHEQLGNRQAAERDLEAFLAKDKDSPQAHQAMGKLYKLYFQDFAGRPTDSERLKIAIKPMPLKEN